MRKIYLIHFFLPLSPVGKRKWDVLKKSCQKRDRVIATYQKIFRKRITD